MTDQKQEREALAWKSLALRTRRRVNTAWWLQGFSPITVAAGVLGFATVIYLRSQGMELPLWQVGCAIAGVMILLSGAAYLLARRRFFNVEESMIRLEAHNQMHNALSAAAAGVTPWPKAPAEISDGLSWRWSWVAVPVVSLLGCLLAAFLLPVSKAEAAKPTSLPPPQAFGEIERMLEELKQGNVVEEKELENQRQSLEDLKGRKAEDWYSHTSLEAADNLKGSLRDAAAGMQESMEKAEQSLDSLQNHSDEMSEAARQQAAQEYQQAVKDLQNSPLAVNKELMEQLQQTDPTKAPQLNKEQLDKLRQKLQEKAEACKDCKQGGDPKMGQGENGAGQGKGEMSADEQALREQLEAEKNGKQGQPGKGKGQGQGEGKGEGEDGEESKNQDGGKGDGDIQRGPGTVPLGMEEKESQLDTNNPVRPENTNFDNALPGDNLGTQDGEHEVDQSPVGPSQGGDVRATGEGGDAVWRESLMPDEKRVLREYFKD